MHTTMIFFFWYFISQGYFLIFSNFSSFFRGKGEGNTLATYNNKYKYIIIELQKGKKKDLNLNHINFYKGNIGFAFFCVCVLSRVLFEIKDRVNVRLKDVIYILVYCAGLWRRYRKPNASQLLSLW